MSNSTWSHDSKVLIAFYSYSGNTRRLAEQLRARTAGVLYGIDIDRPYTRRSEIEADRERMKNGNLPSLRHALPNMSFYDLILIGGPVWWYTLAAPVASFLDKADFSGKPVAPFCTHGGGVGSYFADFQNAASNAHVLPGQEIYAFGTKTFPREQMNRWLETLWAAMREGSDDDKVRGVRGVMSPVLHTEGSQCSVK